MTAIVGLGTCGGYTTAYADSIDIDEKNADTNIEADDGIMPHDVIARQFISYKSKQACE